MSDDEYQAGRCVIGSKEHQAHVGYLCSNHLERLAAMLRQVEFEALHLDARPSMQIRTGVGKGSMASERTPARLDAIAFADPRTRRWEPETEQTITPPQPKSVGPWCLFCEHDSCQAWRVGRRRDLHDDEHDAGSANLASVLDELHNWARLIREERDLTGPDAVTVPSERDTLSRHLTWAAEQPWIDEMWADIKKLLGQLEGINGTAPEKPIGRCYLPADDGHCDGPIWVDTIAGHAHCGRCRQTWDGHQLAMLHYEMERARRPKDERGEPMWSAQEIADEHSVKVGTVAVWAHRRGIVSASGYYDPRLFRDKATA